MTSAEWHSTLFQFIGVLLSLFTFIGSVIAIYYTYQNLKEMRNQLNEQKSQYFEQNRGNLIFYITKSDIGITHDLIIKNFGNSPAKLIFIKITPDLDWSKAGQTHVNDFNITKLTIFSLLLTNIQEPFSTLATLRKMNSILKSDTLLVVKSIRSNIKST